MIISQMLIYYVKVKQICWRQETDVYFRLTMMVLRGTNTLQIKTVPCSPIIGYCGLCAYILQFRILLSGIALVLLYLTNCFR